MSRIIVKNLPKKITEEKLRELFSEKGILTDVQLKYTKDGKFRQFAFIGYKHEKDAQAAVEYFNNSCINTAKISVSISAELGDASKPKSWSKYSADSNVNKLSNDKEKSDEKVEVKKKEKNKKKSKKEKDAKSDKVKDALKKHKDDPLFQEFLETKTKHGELKSVWNNDILLSTETKDDSDESGSESSDDEKEDDNKQEEEKPKIAKMPISDLEYMQMLKKKSASGEETVAVLPTTKSHGAEKFFTVKISGLSYNHKKKHVKQFFKPLKPKSIRVPRNIKGIAFVGFKLERHMKQALNKNKSFLGEKQIFVTKYEDKKVDNNKESDEPNKIKYKKQEENLKDEESIAESGCIYFRNLPYSTNEDDLKSLFEKYGPVTEINLPVDRDTRKIKGFGTVTFLMPEHAVAAHSALDGTSFQGRLLHLLPGKTKISPADLLQQDGLSHKEKKALMQKATAGSSHNWNTLFLGQNAVVDAISSAYNVDKEEVLKDSSQGPSVAVRLALGETQLVEKTRKFLEDNGVCLNAFNQPSVKRSKTVILVKNLPNETKVEEIRDLFAKFGVLARVVMPPSGITALIEFDEPSEAQKAFKKLAYTRFKYLPLYLEWAPEDAFTGPPQKQTIASKKTDVKENVEDKDENEEDDDDDDEPEPDTTLFVKNLKFSTTEEQLRKHFGKIGKLHYVNIPTKKDPKNPGQKLSLGYGFIRYKTKADTNKALKELQLTTLDGKTLELKRSERTLQTDVKTARKSTKITPQTGSKICVRNVPFQAKPEEIEEIFKTYGQLKNVRLPKKMAGTGKHRGFGFVEYHTKKDAKVAFKALCQSTHLYGRRLHLEWANDSESIEEIRKRTAKHFHEEPAAKKSKKIDVDADLKENDEMN